MVVKEEDEAMALEEEDLGTTPLGLNVSFVVNLATQHGNVFIGMTDLSLILIKTILWLNNNHLLLHHSTIQEPT